MRPKRTSTLALTVTAALALLLPFPNVAGAIHHNVTVLGDTQCTNDTAIQLLRVRQDSADASSWNNCVKLTFQNAAGALTGDFALHQDPPRRTGSVAGSATAELAVTPGPRPPHTFFRGTLTA